MEMLSLSPPVAATDAPVLLQVGEPEVMEQVRAVLTPLIRTAMVLFIDVAVASMRRLRKVHELGMRY